MEPVSGKICASRFLDHFTLRLGHVGKLLFEFRHRLPGFGNLLFIHSGVYAADADNAAKRLYQLAARYGTKVTG